MRLSFFIFGFFLFINTSLAQVSDNCAYKGQFDQCVEANKNGNPRSIEDFVCISSKENEKIMSQIILDLEFKKIDKEIEKYLKDLEDNKNKYFGKNASNSFLEAIDEIEEKFSLNGEFGKKYMNFCISSRENSIVNQTISCFGGNASNIGIKDFFRETDCRNLVLTKLSINKQVSYDILKLNKHQVRNDEKKLYTQEKRERYNKLLDLIMVNIGYLERIWKKWPSKTKSAH